MSTLVAQDVIVDARQLQDLAARLYVKAGGRPDDAALLAEVLVETDLRGVHSHGTRTLPRYLQCIEDGQINPRPDITVVREKAASALLDGDRGVGHLASLKAADMAIAKARQGGIGAVVVRNSNHLGAAAVYAMRIAREGMIGYATTNTGGASVAAFGGKEVAVANNPLAYAIPSGDGIPIVLDMACGVSSWGKVATYRMYGKSLTPGWCLDEAGEETLDPKAAKTMLPAAGPRGYGLAFVVSALTGGLAGGSLPISKRDGMATDPSEHFIQAIDIEAFTDREAFLAEIADGAAKIRATAPAAGFEGVTLPGEIEWRRAERWRREGIQLHRDHVQSLRDAAERLGVPAGI